MSATPAMADRCLSAIEYVELCSMATQSEDPAELAALAEIGAGDSSLIDGLVQYANMLETMLVVALTKTRGLQMALATQSGESQQPVQLEADITAIRSKARDVARKAMKS